MESSRLQDYEIDDANRTMRFMLIRPTGLPGHKVVELVFRDVEGYLLKIDRETDSALAVEERRLAGLLGDN